VTVVGYIFYCRELRMLGLWLAVGLALAAAAPQEIIEQFNGEKDVLENSINESGEEIKTLTPEVVNDTTKEDDEANKNNFSEQELTTSSILEFTEAPDLTITSSESSENVNKDLSKLTKEFPDELYLPDEDPIDNTIDDTLGSDDIIDVITNFIAEKDPMLQLYLSICFIHPACFQLDSSSSIIIPHTQESLTPLAQDLAHHLSARRTETARTILVGAVMDVQKQIKSLMFKYIREGVGARGVSILATKTIIDSIKSIWESLNGDLEYAKSSIEELFYLLPLDTKEQVEAVVEIAEVVQRIPARTEQLLQEATQEGYQDYVRDSSWDSWKRNGVK